MVGVDVTVAVAVAEGSGLDVPVGSGAASAVAPQAVKNIDTNKDKRISFFIRFMNCILVSIRPAAYPTIGH
jgi:hypothetical protein